LIIIEIYSCFVFVVVLASAGGKGIPNNINVTIIPLATMNK
jgi:hypothetical protein